MRRFKQAIMYPIVSYYAMLGILRIVLLELKSLLIVATTLK